MRTFLLCLLSLTSLSLGFRCEHEPDVPRILAALQTCTQLSELSLDGSLDLSAEQLASCSSLVRMPIFHFIGFSDMDSLRSPLLPLCWHTAGHAEDAPVGPWRGAHSAGGVRADSCAA